MGRAWYSHIALPRKKVAIAMLIHELAHIIDAKKRGTSKHDKKLMRIILMIHKYSHKKHYWITTDLVVKTEQTRAIILKGV
jgi:CRISPR/Cas system CMR-associated protein Cmr1 (group 7 of RAMP superfamily)